MIFGSTQTYYFEINTFVYLAERIIKLLENEVCAITKITCIISQRVMLQAHNIYLYGTMTHV